MGISKASMKRTTERIKLIIHTLRLKSTLLADIVWSAIGGMSWKLELDARKRDSGRAIAPYI